MRIVKFSLFVAVVFLVIIFSSCSSSQTFTVQGVPGTIISSPANQQLAVVDNSGQAQIKLDRKEGYYHYLQAQMPGSSLQVPFALDYKNHSRAMKRGLLMTATGISITASMVGAIGCGICALTAAEEGLIICGEIAAGAGIFGIGFGLSLTNLPEKIESDYDYLKTQSTNNDILR